MQPSVELFADARQPASRTRVQRWKRGLGIYGRGPGSPTSGTQAGTGGQERERGAASRRGDVTLLDGSWGPRLGGSRPLPLSPHSGRSLGLSCGLLRILLTPDQPACAKPSTSHGSSCPRNQKVRVEHPPGGAGGR